MIMTFSHANGPLPFMQQPLTILQRKYGIRRVFRQSSVSQDEAYALK